jgi:ABC-type sugar transport system ATPase subunit
MSETFPDVLLRVEHVSKRFGSFNALDDVSLSVAAGEVHGLLGANGAGKSTLIGILSGATTPDSGSISVDGRMLQSGSLAASRSSGVIVVHQELMLFPDRSVEENIYASVLPVRPFEWVSDQMRRVRTAAVLDRLGARIELKRRVGELPLSQQQLVEIARALCAGGRILVLDEPTSALSQAEADGLFDAIRAIVRDNAAVILVTHRLDEVFSVTDSMTVLRDGRRIAHWKTSETDVGSLTHAMIGDLADERPASTASKQPGQLAIALHGSAADTEQIDLEVHAGEVVGLAGLEGSGVATVLQMLGGVIPVRGRVEVAGEVQSFHHPLQAIERGVVFMPPDRKTGGLWLDRTVASNIGASAVARMAPMRPLTSDWLRSFAKPRLVEVGVTAAAIGELVQSLSGGNQQRVLLSRSLAARPAVLLLNDFTRGVDVGAKAAIHGLIRQLSQEGLAICVTSPDLDELLSVAHRIVCMRNGRIVVDRPSGEFDKFTLLASVSSSAAAMYAASVN